MPTPQISFEWKWNLTTIATLVGFFAMFVAWGYTLAEFETGRAQNAANIEDLAKESATFQAKLELIDRTLIENKQLDYRVAQIEKGLEVANERMNRMSEAYSNQFAEMRSQLNSIATQIALTNQTLNQVLSNDNNAIVNRPPTAARPPR